jgi:periplasmic protein TonB
MTRDVEKTTPFLKDDMKAAKAANAKAGAPSQGRAVGPMFSNYEADKKRKMPRWAAPLLASAVLFHVVLFVSMWVKTIWDIEQLDRPKNSMDLAIAAPPPPPPPPPKGGAKPKDVVITPKKVKVKDIVQPVKIEKQETKQEDAGDPNGEVGGEVGGVAGGVVGGDINGVVGAPPPPPPPPPPPAPPQIVPPTLLEGSRVAGNAQIAPADVTKTEIQRSGKDKIVGTFKLCITITGDVNTVSMIKSTGFNAYDAKIQGEMRAWRYRPYMVNGKVVPVCTAVTFIYSQH